jgi:hypothetical protein
MRSCVTTFVVLSDFATALITFQRLKGEFPALKDCQWPLTSEVEVVGN